jgi:hypothetical protein
VIAKPSQTKANTRRTMLRRRRQMQLRWPALVLAFLALAAAVYFAMATSFWSLFPSQASSEESAQISDPKETHAGKIILKPNTGECEQMKFDNDSGRVTGDVRTCDSEIVLDSHGVPVPMGTIHRLNAIGDSFRGK